MQHYCTITTYSHLYKVLALRDSLVKTSVDILLHVLIIDKVQLENENESSVRFYNLNHLKNFSNAGTIVRKYFENKDKLRWSLKPVFMKYLLQNYCGQIVYSDNDIFFFNSNDFLFDLLNEHSFLLSPHYYKCDPNNDQNWFEANFRVGLFNAGFVGANKEAINTLQWWADCCAYRCEKNPLRGLFDDQKYLDLVQVIEPNAHIIQHKGCNIAGWNKEVCYREIINGAVRIAGEYPIVFIHFNDTSIREILNGKDLLLQSYYDAYVHSLKKYKPDLKEDELLFHMPFWDKLKYGVWKIITEFGI